MKLEQWNNETMEQWCWNKGTRNRGTMEQWNNGTMEQWSWNNGIGKMEQWNNGTMEQWYNGTMELEQ